MSQETKFDAVSFIMELESGELSEDQVVEGMQQLIDAGTVWSLQGSYVRLANQLIEAGKCTRPAPAPQAVGKTTKVGPYEMVSKDQIRKCAGEDYRLVLYGAYNAMGLIGSECNGIAVLSETRREVICDELGKESSGYFGPSDAQVRLFDHLVKCSDEEFRAAVNRSSRLRMSI